MKWKSPTFLALAVLAVAALALAAPASGQILFDAQLTGFAEVPPVDSDAFGSCSGVLTGFGGPDPDPSFHITCEHNVVDATMAHIHIGAPGVAGDVVFDLGDPDDIDETWDDLSLDEAIRLLAGGYYVNVHSPTHPAGEVRGQLTARQGSAGGVETITFALTGDQETPPVATDASGLCVATIERSGLPEQGEMDLYCTHDVDNVTAAHIHRGAVGVPGPIVVHLGDPTSPIIVEDIFLDPTLAEDLREGLLYVNVHSTEFPGGEIRGQITGCFGSTTVLCLANGRFAVQIDWATDRDDQDLSGQGVAVRETDNTGMFWFFEPSNLEIMVKVLEGCVVNDHFWVFFAGLTDVGFDLRVTDTVSGEVRIYSNADETPANPVLDTAAFETCDVP